MPLFGCFRDVRCLGYAIMVVLHSATFSLPFDRMG